MKRIIFMLIMPLSILAQPSENPPYGPNHPSCNTPNPPFWCNDPVPLDDYIWLLIALGAILGSIIVYKSTNLSKLSQDKG